MCYEVEDREIVLIGRVLWQKPDNISQRIVEAKTKQIYSLRGTIKFYWQKIEPDCGGGPQKNKQTN